MRQTVSTNNYNRADMAAMLTALPHEEQQWTLNYLNNIMLLRITTDKTAKPITSFRGFCSKGTDLKTLRRRAMKEKFGL